MNDKLDRIKSNLTRIEKRYNPEFDVPNGPQVTYSDYQLLVACRSLVDEVERLNGKVKTLTERLNELEA